MKKIWLEILCVFMWILCGFIYLFRAINGEGVVDNNWANWTCMAIDFVNAGLWCVIAHKRYQIRNAR